MTNVPGMDVLISDTFRAKAGLYALNGATASPGPKVTLLRINCCITFTCGVTGDPVASMNWVKFKLSPAELHKAIDPVSFVPSPLSVTWIPLIVVCNLGPHFFKTTSLPSPPK